MTIIFKHLIGQSKPNIKWSIVRKGGVKVNKNGPGHMTKMAAMATNSKDHLLLQNRKTYDFETWPEASMNTALQSLYKT